MVQTTIDWNLQKAAEFDVREMVAKSGKARHFSQGALVAKATPTGEVKAMVGGADYEKSHNRAITAKRHPIRVGVQADGLSDGARARLYARYRRQ